jgi:arylsulfatase A-like enzyme
MTGRNPIRTGLTGNISEGEEGVPLDEHMLPETFKSAGYQTWALGKWHLGGTTGPEYLPQNRGFDHFYGFIGGSIHETSHATPSSGLLDWQRNGVDVPEDDGLLSTDLLATEAISLIENRDASRPFFLYLAFHAVHTPYDAPQALKDKYTGLGLTGQQMEYSAMVENMDFNIGRVLDTLASEGIDGNTLVVFASDNGADEGKGGSNLPLRGWKGEVFEGGHRTPAAMRWPGIVPSGVSSTQYVSHMDWLPTLAAAVGISPQSSKPLDGRNRWQDILNGESGRPHAQVIRRGQGVTALDGDWKLVRETNAGAYQLYDVYVDPEETTDLAGLYPAVVTELAAYIDLIEGGNDDDGDWVADDVDECTTLLHRAIPSSPPDQNPAKLRLALKHLDDPLGEQRVIAKGYFNPSADVPAIDPSANGVHVRILDGDGELYDASIPGGIVGSSPCDPADGWRIKISASASKWMYQNKSGGLPDGMGGCIVGGAKGVTRLLISDLTAGSKASYFFKVVAKNAPFTAAPVSPVERVQLSIALGAEVTPGVAPPQAVAGQCAEFALEGAPLPSAAPKPYCKLNPTTGVIGSIRCVGA